MSQAVTLVESGGIAVTAVESGAPQMTVVENGGIAVTLVESGGAPFIVSGGTPALSPELVAAGERLITGIDGFSGRQYMASAPTLTMGAASAASTITGQAVSVAPQHLLDDATKFAPTGPLYQDGVWGYQFRWSTQSAQYSSNGSEGSGWACNVSNLSAFDILIRNGGTVSRNVRIRVNGQWHAVNDYVATAWSGRAYLKVAFAAPVTGLLEFFFDRTVTVQGINLDAGATMLPLDLPAGPTGELWGDSYPMGQLGVWLTTIWGALGKTIGERFGIRDIVVQGRAGQGYVTLADSRTISQRMALDVGYAISSPDIEFMHNSVNDRTADLATLSPSFVDGIETLQGAYPNSWIVVFVGFDRAAAPYSDGVLAGLVAAAQAAADDRTLVIDGTDFPQVATTGTLPNGQAHDSPDGVHPGPNEMAWFADEIVTRVRSALVAKLG